MKNKSLEIIKKTKNELISPEDMKMKIREYIDKLNDSSTRDLYFKNFKTLLQTYTDTNSVNIIFPLLLSYTNDSMTLTGKEYQIILVAFALNIDFIKNITYTILTKIMKAISSYLEKYNNLEIQKACSVVTIEIFDQIIKMGENQENAFTFIIKFYLDLIEKNRAIVSQPKDNGILNGSFVIISDLLCYIINLNSGKDIKEGNSEIKNEGIEQINRKIDRDEIEKASNLNSLQKILEETLFNLINKFIIFKYPNPYLIESINYLIDIITYDDYKNKIIELIPHTNKVLYNTDAKLYLSKIMICHLYSHLFKKMSLPQDEKFITEMIEALKFTTKDRVVKVQIAAEEALLIYNNLIKEEKSDENNTTIQTRRKMSKLNLLRNLSKINKEKNNIMSSKKVRKEIYEIGIGKFLRSNDYLNNRDEENLLMLKKDINKSKSKSKEKKERSISKKKMKKIKRKSDDNKNRFGTEGGVMIFPRFNGLNDEISKEDDTNNINNKLNDIKFKSAKNNAFMKSLKDKDINLNDDIDIIKRSLTKKEKERKESENGNNELKDNKLNLLNKNRISNKNNNININENDIEKKEENEERDEKEENEEKDKKDIFSFKEEENNIGDQSTPNYKEKISAKKVSNKSKKNKRLNSKENSENNEKLGNSNNDLNMSDNNDSSNIQGNTVEDVNKINTLSKHSSKNKIKNIKKEGNKIYNNDLLNQLNKTFKDELDKLVNNFELNTNNKLNKMNNRLLGLSQNVNRIKTNLNLIKHTNNLNFKDSNVIINEEREEQSVDSSITKNVDKNNYKSYNILWETITLYLKNENYEEAAFYNMNMLNIKYFSVEELNDFMQTLFEIKTLKNDTGKYAQILYDRILKDFNSQNK